MKQKGALVKNASKNESVQKIKKGKVQNKPPIKVAPTPKKGAASIKKPNKIAVKAPPPKEDSEDEDDDEEEEDSGADVQNFGQDDSAEDSEELSAEDSEDDDSAGNDIAAAVDGEDDDDDDDDDEDDEEENNVDEKSAQMEEDEDSDDDAPVEQPISKKKVQNESKPTKGGIPKIKNGPIPEDTPDEHVIVVKNLPPKCKEIDFVKIFAKYGTMEAISSSKLGRGLIAFIAFSAADEAEAALAANKSNFKGFTIEVESKKPTLKKKHVEGNDDKRSEKIKEYENCKNRTVYIKNLHKNTTKEDLESLFAQCGTIESVTLKTFKVFTYAFITYSKRDEAIDSLKLNNTKLNGVAISVFLKDGKNAPMPENRTIILINKNELLTIEEDKIKSIFAKCGEIEDIHIRGNKKVLAFIIFKKEESIENAMKLNGTTVKGLEIELEEFKKIERINTQVFVNNISRDVTEEDIREFFSVSGEVVNIVQKPGFAIVKFKDQDGYCKSFLQNEAKLKNQMIFLEPYSVRKLQLVKTGKKRPMPPPKKTFSKKFKTQK